MYLELNLEQTPVFIEELQGAPLNTQYPMRDDISASEEFPGSVGEEGATYILRLRKPVTRAEDVEAADHELQDVLLRLAGAWIFSGGSHMALEIRQAVGSPSFSSNARAVEQLLLRQVGRTRVHSAPVNFAITIRATYSQPPLSLATQIAELMRDDFLVNRVVNYYRSAALNRRGFEWCLHIYKVRDLLSMYFGGERATRHALRIRERDWRHFGSLLNNNDLRHADVSGTPPTIAYPDVDWLFDISRKWLATFIRTKGIGAIG